MVVIGCITVVWLVVCFLVLTSDSSDDNNGDGGIGGYYGG